MAYKICKCGSTHFTRDILNGWQDIAIDNEGDIIDCDTNVTEAGTFVCVECGKEAKEKK